MDAPGDRIAIDLFACAGGLSLGLTAARFAIALSVEASPMAAETYYRNFVEDSGASYSRHIGQSVDFQVRSGLAVCPTASVLASFEAVESLVAGVTQQVDLIAG